MAPVALDLLMERAKAAREEGRWLAAGIKAEIWNVNLDLREHRRLTAQDFMPGAKTEADEMREFVEKVQRGESFAVDPAAAKAFRKEMEESFRNVTTGKVSLVGPKGKMEVVRFQ